MDASAGERAFPGELYVRTRCDAGSGAAQPAEAVPHSRPSNASSAALLLCVPTSQPMTYCIR